MEEKFQSRNPSYPSPKLEARSTEYGMGMFCITPIEKGEIVAVFGGTVCNWEELQHLESQLRSLSIQIEDDAFLVPHTAGPGEFFNHSCEPNAGMRGQITLVALRPIKVGEQVCYDYAMTDTRPYDEFDCGCGAQSCRKKVTGNDWKSVNLQEKYRGYFAAYVERRIDQSE